MKKSFVSCSAVLVIILSSCTSTSPNASTPQEIKAYCLGVVIEQAVQMEFQDYELSNLESDLNGANPSDSILASHKEKALNALSEYRQLKDETNFIALAQALTSFNNKCAEYTN